MSPILDLGNSWSQLPPTKDGHYWFLHSKPWDDPIGRPDLIEIRGGKKVAEVWLRRTPGPDGEVRYRMEKIPLPKDEQEVWSDDQSDIKAAWKWAEDSNPWRPPPWPINEILDRYPATCPICGGKGADYMAGGGSSIKEFCCYSKCIQ